MEALPCYPPAYSTTTGVYLKISKNTRVGAPPAKNPSKSMHYGESQPKNYCQTPHFLLSDLPLPIVRPPTFSGQSSHPALDPVRLEHVLDLFDVLELVRADVNEEAAGALLHELKVPVVGAMWASFNDGRPACLLLPLPFAGAPRVHVPLEGPEVERLELGLWGLGRSVVDEVADLRACESAPNRDPPGFSAYCFDCTGNIGAEVGPDRRRSGPTCRPETACRFSSLPGNRPGSRFGADSQHLNPAGGSQGPFRCQLDLLALPLGEVIRQ